MVVTNSKAVTLNLFQGPNFGLQSKTLKQVQGDGVGEAA